MPLWASMLVVACASALGSALGGWLKGTVKRRCRLCNGPVYRLVQLDGSKDWVHVFEDMRHSAVVKRWWRRQQ